MFSYRHAFHVGNHADVLKHAILVAILRHLALKDKSFWVFDTHAGAGRYRLDAAQTRKNAEYRSGIEALWRARKLPALLAAHAGAEGILRVLDGTSARPAGTSGMSEDSTIGSRWT